MFQALENITARSGVLGVAASALASHYYFNRYEPTAIPVLSTLLLIIPAAASPVLAHHYGIILGTAATFLVYYATLATSIALYRISPFHPLARHPGPFLARITKWYWTWIALSGRTNIILQQLHDKYGDVVRVGPNELSVVSLSLAEPVLSSQGPPKGPAWWARNLAPPVQSLVALMDKADHSQRRKQWAPALGTEAIRRYEPLISKRASDFVELLLRKKKVDYVRDVALFTYDFMSEALFTHKSGLLKNDDQNGVVDAMMTGFIESHIYEHVPWLAQIARKLPGIGENTKQFRADLTKRGAERLEKGSTEKDLFYYLANEDGDEKERPDIRTILADSGLAIIAGTAPGAGALANAMFCLLTHPESYKRLQAEVDKYYPADADPSDTKHLSDMPFLTAVLNEALRLFPAVPDGTQRTPTKGSGGFMAGDVFIPEFTNVRVPIYAMHRHPQYWSRPDEWFPDRWLIAKGLQKYDGELKHTPNAFMPFSMGPRNCAGRNLAMLEMKMLMVHLMQRLEFRFQEGREVTMEQWMDAIRDKNALILGELPIAVAPRF